MNADDLSQRARNVGGRIFAIHNPGMAGMGWHMPSPKLVRQVIKDGSIRHVIGAGRMTINELRQYAGIKPETIKRCPTCGSIIK